MRWRYDRENAMSSILDVIADMHKMLRFSLAVIVLLNISREGEIFVKTGFFLLLLLVVQCAKISNSCGKLQIRALITWDHER